ncbi:MAG: peptidylprolyl isomerase [Caulobacteraceae bacterium]
MLAPCISFAAAPNWRDLDPENALLIETTKGRVIVEMTPETAPAHVVQIKALARKGTYDGNTFFRVIDRFMAQTGDPDNTGEGGSDLPNLKAEFIFRRDAAEPFATVRRPMGLQEGFIKSVPVVSQDDSYKAVTSDKKLASWATYCPGVAGMARGDDNDSANSQFFIMRQAYPSLDKRYSVWGRAVAGVDVVRSIKTGEPVDTPDRMIRVRVLADVPAAERPRVRIMDAGGSAFAAEVAKKRKLKGADFSICDVDLAIEVK